MATKSLATPVLTAEESPILSSVPILQASTSAISVPVPTVEVKGVVHGVGSRKLTIVTPASGLKVMSDGFEWRWYNRKDQKNYLFPVEQQEKMFSQVKFMNPVRGTWFEFETVS